MQHALINPNPLVVSAETRFILCTPGSVRRDWLGSGDEVWWSSVESRDLALDTVKSVGPTAVNKYPNTRTTNYISVPVTGLIVWRDDKNYVAGIVRLPSVVSSWPFI